MNIPPRIRTIMQVVAAIIILGVFVASIIKPDQPVGVPIALFLIAAILGLIGSGRGQGG